MAALNEKLRVVVVGGVAGGASAAARVKRLNENADVVVFEKGSDVSFSNCGLPYYLSGTVEDSEDLIMMTPAAFRKKHDIDVRVHSEVVSIDREKKTVTVRSTETGETYEQPYDKLVLSPGANPIVPPALKGADRENVFTIRNVRDIVALKTFLDSPRRSMSSWSAAALSVSRLRKICSWPGRTSRWLSCPVRSCSRLTRIWSRSCTRSLTATA